MYGGAVKAVGAKNVVINNSTIKNNFAKNSGSAIGAENTESVLIQKTTITDNTGTNSGTVHVKNCGDFVFDKDSIVKNNKAGEAGGISVAETNATIAGTIEENEATKSDGNGGGLYTFLSDKTKTVTITETAVIKNNIAGGAGGGIYVNGPKVNAETGKLVMNGGSVTGNTAKGTPAEGTLKDGGGAGAYVARGSMVINGGTIENNTSTSGIGNGILVSHAGGNTEAGKLEITNGKIEGTIELAQGGIEITGGTFTTDVSDYLADGVELKKDEENDTYVIPVRLDAPTNVKWNGTKATWDAVPNAASYVVIVCDEHGQIAEDIVTEDTSVDLAEYLTDETKEYMFVVIADSNKVAYLLSIGTESETYVFPEEDNTDDETTEEVPEEDTEDDEITDEGTTDEVPGDTEDEEIKDDDATGEGTTGEKEPEEEEDDKKDDTPATGSIDTVLFVSAIVAVISVAGIALVKKYTR